MKKRLVSALFLISFTISGCGIEAMFDHPFEWGFAFLVAIACLMVLSN